MKKMTKRSIMNNVILLYCVFIVMCVNIGYLLSRNDYQSILIFSISCFIIYLINHNMIVVIGAGFEMGSRSAVSGPRMARDISSRARPKSSALL